MRNGSVRRGAGSKIGTWGREHVCVVLGHTGCQAPERRRVGLHRHQLRFPEHGQRRQRAAVRHRVRFHAIEQARDGRGAYRGAQLVAKRREQFRLTCFGVARFEGVVVVGAHVCGVCDRMRRDSRTF